MKPARAKRWAILRRSNNSLDGRREYLVGDYSGLPMMFKARAQCRQHIEQKYGYIRSRPDLRAEPHGWKMPVAVKVIVTVVRTP